MNYLLKNEMNRKMYRTISIYMYWNEEKNDTRRYAQLKTTSKGL